MLQKEGHFYFTRKGRNAGKGDNVPPTALSQGFAPRLSASFPAINLSVVAKPFPPAFRQALTPPIPSSPFLRPPTPFLDFSSLFHGTQLHLLVTAQSLPILLRVYQFHEITCLGFQLHHVFKFESYTLERFHFSSPFSCRMYLWRYMLHRLRPWTLESEGVGSKLGSLLWSLGQIT